MNHDTKEESTMESDVAKPLTTLSAYFITNATSMPPRDTCAARGVDARRAEERCGGVEEVQRGGAAVPRRCRGGVTRRRGGAAVPSDVHLQHDEACEPGVALEEAVAHHRLPVEHRHLQGTAEGRGQDCRATRERRLVAGAAPTSCSAPC